MKYFVMMFLLGFLPMGCGYSDTEKNQKLQEARQRNSDAQAILDAAEEFVRTPPVIGAWYLCPAELIADSWQSNGGRYFEVHLKQIHNGAALVEFGGGEVWVNYNWLKQPPLPKKERE